MMELSESLKLQGWILAKSSRTGKTYYFNTRTNESTYEPPRDNQTKLNDSNTAYDVGVSSHQNENSNSDSGTAFSSTADDQQATAFSTSTEDASGLSGSHFQSINEHEAAAHVNVAYTTLKQQTHAERAKSDIVVLRKFNNWVKSVLIQEYVPDHCSRVLDLACGKLGDLRKWIATGVTKYVGVDISLGQVKDAAGRYNSHISSIARHYDSHIAQGLNEDQFGKLFDEYFSAKLAVADLGVVDLANCGLFDDANASFKSSNRRETFHAISIQFALHYLFASEQRAVNFFKNIADRLTDDGVFIGTTTDANVLVRYLRDLPEDKLEFGNKYCTVRFTPEAKARQWALKDNPFGVQYTFRLQDQVENIDEYLVPLELLELLANMAGMELVATYNFHDFYQHMINHPIESRKQKYRNLLRKVGLVGPGSKAISDEEWMAAGLYRTFVFAKKSSTSVVPNTSQLLKTPSLKNIGNKQVFASAHPHPLARQKWQHTIGEQLPHIETLDVNYIVKWPENVPRVHIPYRNHITDEQIYDIAATIKQIPSSSTEKFSFPAAEENKIIVPALPVHAKSTLSCILRLPAPPEIPTECLDVIPSGTPQAQMTLDDSNYQSNMFGNNSMPTAFS